MAEINILLQPVKFLLRKMESIVENNIPLRQPYMVLHRQNGSMAESSLCIIMINILMKYVALFQDGLYLFLATL